MVAILQSAPSVASLQLALRRANDIIQTQRLVISDLEDQLADARAPLQEKLDYREAIDRAPKFGSNGNLRSFVHYAREYEQRNKPLESGPYAGLYCYDMAGISGAYGCFPGNAGDQARKLADAGLMRYEVEQNHETKDGRKITLSYGLLSDPLLSRQGLATLDNEPITANGGPHILPRCQICGAAIHRVTNTIETQTIDTCTNGHKVAHIPERHNDKIDLSYLGKGTPKTTLAPSMVTTGGDSASESDQVPQNHSGFGKNHTCAAAISLDQAQKKAKTRVVLGAIPAELQSLDQWIVWRYGRCRPGGKREKPPYNAKIAGSQKKPCDDTDPASWASFDQALALYTESQAWTIPYDGIGFCFSESDPFCGIDFDDCIGQETGALVERAEHTLILSIPGVYVEISPSAKGVKAIVRGRLARNIKTDAIELYDRGHYFTITGAVLPGTQPGVLVEAQSELDVLVAVLDPVSPDGQSETAAIPCASTILVDDSALVERAKRANNGAGEKFARLWQGDMSSYGSASQADLALCNYLAWQTGNDAARMDSLFRQSGLMRAKWDRSAGKGKTYGQKTIERAIGGQPPVDTKPSPKTAPALRREAVLS